MCEEWFEGTGEERPRGPEATRGACDAVSGTVRPALLIALSFLALVVAGIAWQLARDRRSWRHAEQAGRVASERDAVDPGACPDASPGLAAGQGEIVRSAAEPADSPEADSATARIHVYWEQDGFLEPIAGALVTALHADEDGLLSVTSWTARTAEDGLALLQVPRAIVRRSLGGVELRVMARHDGFAPDCGTFCVDLEGDIVLSPACTIYGRVLEAESGNAIAGAGVSFGVVGPDLWRSGGPTEVVTDSSGWYRYEEFPVGGDRMVRVLRDGYATAEFVITAGDWTEERVDLRVPGGRTLSGRVLDAESMHPLEDVRVVGLDGRCLATTNDWGWFAVGGLTRDPTAVRLLLPGYCCTVCWSRTTEGRDSGEQQFPMFRSCSVEGLVLGGGGEPVQGAVVRVQGYAPPVALPERYPDFAWENVSILPDGGHRDVRTDAQGHFRVMGLVPGCEPISIRVEHPKDRRELLSEPIVLEACGDTRHVTMAFPAGGVIEGSIEPRGGDWAIEWRSGTMSGEASVRKNGAYRLVGVPAGDVLVRVMDGTEAVEMANVLVAEGQTVRRDFWIAQEWQGIAGVVLRPNGEPVHEATVELPMFEDGLMRDDSTDAAGRFRIRVGMDIPGEFRLEYGSPVLDVEGPVVHVGDEDVVLILPETGRCAMRIVDEDSGLPLSGAEIRWEWKGEHEGRAISLAGSTTWWPDDPEGVCSVYLPVGATTLTVRPKSAGYDEVVVEGFHAELESPSSPRTVRVRRR